MDVDEPRGGGGRVETPNVIYIENPQEIIKKNLTIFNQTEAAEKALEAAYAAEQAAAAEQRASQLEEQEGTSTRAQKNKLNSAIKDALEARAFAKKEQRKVEKVEKAKQTGFRSSLQGDNKINYPCFFIGGRLYNLSDIRNMFKSVDSFLEMDFDDPKISDSDWAEIAHRVFELGRDVIDITNLKIEYDENGDPIVTGTYELPEKESFSSVKRDPFTRKEYTIEDLELMRRMSKNIDARVTRDQEAKNEFTARERLVVGSHIPRYAMHILPSRSASSPPFFDIRVIPPLPTLYKKTGFGGLSSIYTADKLHHTYKLIWDFLEAEAESAEAAVAGEEDYDSHDERLSQYSLGGRNKKSRSLTRKQRKSRRLIRKKKSRKQKKSRKSRKLRRNKH
jgi:hypothetical protein